MRYHWSENVKRIRSKMQIACLGHTEADAMYAAAAFLRDQIEASKNQREVLLAIVSILEDGVKKP